MTKQEIIVEKPGLLTTIQDLGRIGYQQYGVVVAGVMDSFAARVANILVGNDDNEAVLEMTVIGPTLVFQGEATIAVCGGGLIPCIDGKRQSLWKTIHVKKGETLHFETTNEGARSYVAVAGGLNGETMFHSQSTYLRGRFGGYNGRALQKGDRLIWKKPKKQLPFSRQLVAHAIPSNKRTPIRIVLGPDADLFSEEGLATFLTSEYTVSSASDRMGYRLEGEKIGGRNEGSLISDAVTFGTIQVTVEGLPIIMMADRQTTGGYPRIAHVITVDLRRVAQLNIGDSLTFTPVSLEEAHSQYRKREIFLKHLKMAGGMFE